MKNNKGFTLIELLAVIVILAIIALIATPIVLGIIDDARNGAKDSTAQMIIDNVELAYSTAYIKNNGVTPTLAQVAEAFKMDGVSLEDKDENGATDGIYEFIIESGHATCSSLDESKISELVVTCTPDYEGAKDVSTNDANGMTLTAPEAEPTTPGTDTTEPGTENTDPAQGA